LKINPQFQLMFRGQEYSSPDEMPGAAQAPYEQAMKVFVVTDPDAMPDLVEDTERGAQTPNDPVERLKKLKGLNDPFPQSPSAQ
jgi:hypothetical protein